MRVALNALIWLAVLSAVGLGMGLWMARPLVAAACPQCFGFGRLQEGVYVDSAMSPASRTHLAEVLTASENRIANFYGGLQHLPRVLVCASDGCYRRIGGERGSGTGTAGSYVLVVSPEGVDTVALSEALAHTELRGRVGAWRISMGAVPMWFEQGTAVVAANDPLYIGPVNRGNRCLAGPFPDMPATPSEWNDELQQEGDVLYAQSACQTYMWMESHGGPTAITGLLTKVSDGQDFAALYR